VKVALDTIKQTKLSIQSRFDIVCTGHSTKIQWKSYFFRGWKEYEDGFGSIDKEFWLG
jgi:hypothetical protein